VWRSLRRLGVADPQLDDAVQDVFLVVYRRLADFEGRSSVRTWLFGIALRVAKDYRRTATRRPEAPLSAEPQTNVTSPQDAAEVAEQVALLHALLEKLDDDKRAAFILAELEGMSGPELAEALGVPLDTAYSRLRAARTMFNQALARHRAQESRRSS
jgi:RNA polymerase sigma-70 factor (ECF subfamily)